MTLNQKIKTRTMDALSIIVSVVILLAVFFTQAILKWNSLSNNQVIGVLVLVYSVALIYRYRANIGYALMFLVIFYANWSVVVGVYLDPSIRPDKLYAQFEGQEVYSRGIVAMLFFLIVLYLGSFRYHIDNSGLENIWKIFKPNQLGKWGCMALFVAIFFLEFSFVSGGRGEGSALDEYKVIFLLFGCLFSNRKSKIDRCLWTAAAAMTSVLALLSGNRASILSVILILFLLWYQQFFKIKTIIMIFVPGILAMTFVGVTRGVYNGSISMADVFEKLLDEKLTTDTFTFAYVPSIASEALIGKIHNSTELLFDNIAYIFFGGQYGKSILSFVTVEHHFHYGGYIAPTYMDLWFGWGGGIITGLLTQLLIHFSMKKKRYAPILLVGVVSFVFRWYVYNFMLMFRVCFIVLLIYLLILAMSKLMKNMFVKKKNREVFR